MFAYRDVNGWLVLWCHMGVFFICFCFGAFWYDEHILGVILVWRAVRAWGIEWDDPNELYWYWTSTDLRGMVNE